MSRFVHGFGKGRKLKPGRYVFRGGKWVPAKEPLSQDLPARINFCPPPFPRGYSWVHGQKLASWSEYRAANKQANLVDVGKIHEPQDTSLPHSPKQATVVDRDGNPVSK